MYRVTPRRLAKAVAILDGYRRALHSSGTMDARAFEVALRECWNVGYREMKSLAEDLSKIERYRFVAAYYMENSNGSREFVAAEFAGALAGLYGLNSYHDHPADLNARRDEFWASMPREK